MLFLAFELVACANGPKVTVYVSNPAKGGMDFADEKTNVKGFVPYSSTDKFIALTPQDAETLLNYFPETSRTLVFGTTKDKDMVGQLRAILPLFERVIATRYVENPRSVPPEDVARAVEVMSGKTARVAPEPAMALELARRMSGPESLICVTGSLFLAAEARAVVLGQESLRAGTGAAI